MEVSKTITEWPSSGEGRRFNDEGVEEVSLALPPSPPKTRLTKENNVSVEERHGDVTLSQEQWRRLFLQSVKFLQEKENNAFKKDIQEEIVLLRKEHNEQKENTQVLKYKTQRVGQWEIEERNAFFVKMYAVFTFQFIITMALVFTWLYLYPIKILFRENPLPLVTVVLCGMIFSLFFVCGFRRWVVLSLIFINLTFSLLVGLGVLYTDSIFLLECMGAIAIFGLLLCLLNFQKKFAYSTGILLCFVFLFFLISLWHFVYVPYLESNSLDSIFDSAGLKVERLVALVLTVFVCCGYMLYFEEEVKRNYLIEEYFEASMYLYLHILIFIYVVAQLLHLWSVRCRRCRRGADAYLS